MSKFIFCNEDGQWIGVAQDTKEGLIKYLREENLDYDDIECGDIFEVVGRYEYAPPVQKDIFKKIPF